MISDEKLNVALTVEQADALKHWQETPSALRFRILSTTGGTSLEERRVIAAARKPSLEEYGRAQASAACLLRAFGAAAEPDATFRGYPYCAICRGYGHVGAVGEETNCPCRP